MENKCNMSQSGILKNLEKGLKSEEKAMLLCKDLLELVDNQDDKDDLMEIIKDEANHIKITKDLMEIVKNNYIGDN